MNQLYAYLQQLPRKYHQHNSSQRNHIANTKIQSSSEEMLIPKQHQNTTPALTQL